MRARTIRFFLVAAFCSLAFSATFAQVDGDGSTTSEGNIGPTGAQAVDLRTQLEKGLLARRDVEFKYIGRVVAAVESGKLPRSVVDSTFLYARRRPFQKFQYFERALEIRAKKLGITI